MTTLAILKLALFFGVVYCIHIYHTNKYDDLKSDFHKYVIDSQKYLHNKEEFEKFKEQISE